MSCVISVFGLLLFVCNLGHFLSGDRLADLIAVLRMGLLEARPHPHLYGYTLMYKQTNSHYSVVVPVKETSWTCFSI